MVEGGKGKRVQRWERWGKVGLGTGVRVIVGGEGQAGVGKCERQG